MLFVRDAGVIIRYPLEMSCGVSAASLPTLSELREELRDCGSWEEQCAYLMELGEELPDLSPTEKCEANRVLGCQSRVWLVPQFQAESAGGEPVLRIRAKSDGRFVDGLIVVLLGLFDGKTAREVLQTDAKAAFTELGLEAQLVPQRRNGLYSMVERVRSIAASNIESPIATSILPTARVVVLPSEHNERSADDIDWLKVRQDFPILQQPVPSGNRVVYLDSASSAQKPACVVDRERDVYERFYANAYRGVYRFGEMVSQELERTRERVKDFIHASRSDEVIFTSGTTMAINLVANAWGRKFLQPGDEVVITDLEHHANWVPWEWIARETGAVLKFLPLTADGQLDLNRLQDVVTARTKMVSVTGMSNVLGTCPPIREIVRRARQVGSLVFVDGAQSVPHLPTNVVAEGIDFLAFSGHKLYGPSGVGVLWGRYELLEQMDPFLCGGHMINSVSHEGSTWNVPPAKFEAGTPAIAQAIALGTAIEYVSHVGLCATHSYEQNLLRKAHEKLALIPEVKLYGPAPSHKGAIISFTIDGVSADDVARRLSQRGICVRHGHHCAMPLHQLLGVPATVRASFGMYNSMEDVELLAESLQEIATKNRR